TRPLVWGVTFCCSTVVMSTSLQLLSVQLLRYVFRPAAERTSTFDLFDTEQPESFVRYFFYQLQRKRDLAEKEDQGPANSKDGGAFARGAHFFDSRKGL